MKKNTKFTLILAAGVLFMFAFSYMMVPIFTYMCKRAGINGKGVMSASVANPDMQVDLSRTIRIDFSSTLHNRFDFDFNPKLHSVSVHPGERKIIYFNARNKSGHAITVQAVPSITPADSARFFKKIECFCFTQQHFKKNEQANMFVNFYIDPAVPKNVKEMTLSYTLFDATGFEGKVPVKEKGRG